MTYAYHHRNLNVQICDEPIEYVRDFNFLGYTFESHMKAKPHVESIRRKCFNFMNILRDLCGVTWGSDPQNMLKLYFAVVRPKLEYMAPLIFIDGSKIQGKTSCAFWIPSLGIEAEFSLHPDCTIFSEEFLAILESLQFVRGCDKEKYLIISDSISVLQAIEGFVHNRTHPYIIKIRNELDILRQLDYKINFLWVPSHSDIDGNTYVDSFAVEHADTGEYPPIPHVDLWPLDKRRVITEWQIKWDSSVYGRHLYSLSPTVNTIPWFRNRKLSRNVITMICRIRFTHIRIRQHLYKVNIVNSDLCECGVTFACRRIDQRQRNIFIRYLHHMGIQTLKIREILDKDNDRVYRALNKFYKQNDILI